MNINLEVSEYKLLCEKQADASESLSVKKELENLLINGETVAFVFLNGGGQIVFTNKRIISISFQFKNYSTLPFKKTYSTIPLSKIRFFSIQATGLYEVKDSMINIELSSGTTVTIEFSFRFDIAKIGRMISECVL